MKLKIGKVKFGPQALNSDAWQNWCQSGNQANATIGCNLSVRPHPVFSLSMPCQVWGPVRECVHSWVSIRLGAASTKDCFGAVKAVDQNVVAGSCQGYGL
eukprot:scaffold105933_cov15-Tisochrysis_lutea.AAC.1